MFEPATNEADNPWFKPPSQRCWIAWVSVQQKLNFLDCVGGGDATQSSVEQHFAVCTPLMVLTMVFNAIVEKIALNPGAARSG